jgi:hypothetical protein
MAEQEENDKMPNENDAESFADLHSSIKTRLYELSTDSKVHGFSNIFKTKYSVMRFIWILVIMAAIALCIFLVVSAAREFFEYSTTSRVQLVNQSPSPFPRITVCQSNPFVAADAQQFFTDLFVNSTDPDLEAMSSIFNNQSAYSSRQLYSLFKQYPMYMEYLKAVASDPSLNDTLKQALGFSYSYVNIFGIIFKVLLFSF